MKYARRNESHRSIIFWKAHAELLMTSDLATWPWHACTWFQIIKDLVTLFPVIRDWIVEFLDDNKDMTASMVGRNMLIEQVSNKNKQTRNVHSRAKSKIVQTSFVFKCVFDGALRWQWVTIFDPWPTWPMTHQSIDPWPVVRDPRLTTTHESWLPTLAVSTQDH